MKKTKRIVAVILGCMIIVSGAVSTSAAVKAMPYTTECPSCHTNSGVRGSAYNCDYCSASGNAYKCSRCNHGYFRCSNGHCYG